MAFPSRRCRFYVEDNQIIKDLVTYLMAFSTTYEIVRKEIMNSSKIDKLDDPNKPKELKRILDFMNFLYLDTIEHYHSQRRYLEQKYEYIVLNYKYKSLAPEPDIKFIKYLFSEFLEGNPQQKVKK